MLDGGGGGSGGFQTAPGILFRAAVDMVATKEYTYAISGGLAGELAKSAGMAGDDQIAHDFAAKYEPAAKTLVEGIGSAGQAIGVTASKLLATAIDHLRADQRAAGRLSAATDKELTGIDTSTFAQPPQPDCEPRNVSAALPMITGSAEVHEIPVIGKFWPQGNPDKLRDAADSWNRAANLIDDAQRNAGQHAAPVPIYCSGDTINAFQTYVKQIWAADPTGDTTVAAGQPLMENLSAGCRQMARMCQEFADAIDTCRDTIIALGIAAGLVAAGGIILTIFTLGGSDVAAGAGEAAIATEAAAAVATLAAEEEALAAAAVVAEAESIVSSALAQLLASGALAVVAVGGLELAGAGTAQAAPGRLPAVATVPPTDPIPGSGAFPPLSLAEQAANRQWMLTMNPADTRDPNYGTPADQAYQVRVAGQPERHVYSTDGTVAQWIDGYRPEDGAFVEAKHVRDPSCTGRTLDGLNEGNFRTKFTLDDDVAEVFDYSKTLENPANHGKYVEIDVSDEIGVTYWQFLAAASGAPNDVRYVP